MVRAFIEWEEKMGVELSVGGLKRRARGKTQLKELWIGKPSPKVSLLEDRLKQRTWVSGFCCAALTAPGLGRTDFPKWPWREGRVKEQNPAAIGRGGKEYRVCRSRWEGRRILQKLGVEGQRPPHPGHLTLPPAPLQA